MLPWTYLVFMTFIKYKQTRYVNNSLECIGYMCVFSTMEQNFLRRSNSEYKLLSVSLTLYVCNRIFFLSCTFVTPTCVMIKQKTNKVKVLTPQSLILGKNSNKTLKFMLSQDSLYHKNQISILEIILNQTFNLKQVVKE